MKRVLTLILSFSMLISLLSTSAAAATIDSYNVAENEIIGEEYLISEDLLPNGKLSKITAYNFPNGFVVYTYYEDNLKIRDYTVVPGSGYYDVQEYAVSSESTNNHTIAQRPVSKHTVYVGTATNIDTSKASASGYEYWGTVSYYNATMDKTYTIRCTIKEDVNTYGSFSPAGYYADKALFIASVVAFFLWPTKSPLEKAADEIFENALEKKFITLVMSSGTILYIVNEFFTVKSEYTQYHIHGEGITQNPSGEFQSDDGYSAYIYADQGIFSQKTYTGIWTRDDWRHPTLGRLLFWHVYGLEFTPTSWNP